MPFIPHTPTDVDTMLKTIGVRAIEDLFDEIPEALRAGTLKHVPQGRGEMDMLALLGERAERDRVDLCFVGAGSYDHHIPAAVWDIAQRGEFLTAYTPYQAEASQGTLQLIYEYQSMMTALTGMDVSNASVYDGGSGLAEAVLMAVRANKKNKSRHVAMPETVNPRFRDATHAIVRNQQIELTTVPMTKDGVIDIGRTEEPRRDSGRARRAASELLRPSRRRRHAGRLGRRERRCADRLGESVVARGTEAAGGVGQERRRHRLSATASRSAFRWRRAVRRSASCAARWIGCARCRAASSAAPSTSKARPVSR